MELLSLDHFTLRVPPAALPALRDFYTRALALREGWRPDFAFPGHWLYVGQAPVLHLVGDEGAAAPPELAQRGTGGVDHVSLRAAGLAASRQRLRAHGLRWREATVPGGQLHQIFLLDPLGLKIELTFDGAELAAAGALPDGAAA